MEHRRAHNISIELRGISKSFTEIKVGLGRAILLLWEAWQCVGYASPGC